MNDISIRLRKCIEESGMSYELIGKKSKVSRSSIQRYASGETDKIPIDRLEKITRVVGANIAYIMGCDEQEQILYKMAHIMKDERWQKFIINYGKLNDKQKDFIDSVIEMLTE